ncbi:hypothetical protein FCV25MIE_24290 [Fagus crenata]
MKPRNLFAMPNREQEVEDESNIDDMEGLRIDVNVVEGVNLEDDNVFENSDTDKEDDMSIDDEFVGACLDNDEDDDEFLQ